MRAAGPYAISRRSLSPPRATAQSAPRHGYRRTGRTLRPPQNRRASQCRASCDVKRANRITRSADAASTFCHGVCFESGSTSRRLDRHRKHPGHQPRHCAAQRAHRVYYGAQNMYRRAILNNFLAQTYLRPAMMRSQAQKPVPKTSTKSSDVPGSLERSTDKQLEKLRCTGGDSKYRARAKPAVASQFALREGFEATPAQALASMSADDWRQQLRREIPGCRDVSAWR